MIVLSPNVSVPFCLSFHHFNSHTLLISTLVVDDFNHNDLKVRMCPEDIALMVNISFLPKCDFSKVAHYNPKNKMGLHGAPVCSKGTSTNIF